MLDKTIDFILENNFFLSENIEIRKNVYKILIINILFEF